MLYEIVACTAGAAAIFVAAPVAITYIGFTVGGIAAGSAAAGMQAGIGNVVAGSAFATVQSLAATGTFSLGVGNLAGVAVSAVTGAAASLLR